jgi:beta-lactamase regulating signal transducer with metallopeptidase domain
MSAYISLLTALGWSLMASFWQMAILWAACYLLTTGNKRFSAAGKHNLILLFIVFGGEWFMYTFFHLLKEPAASSITGLLPVSVSVGQWLPYISCFYLLILTIRFLQYIIQYHKRHDLKSTAPGSPFIQSFTDRFTRILGITKHVMVIISEKTETAETTGFLKPLVLLPFSLLTRLSPAQVEAILIHELYHIRRNDYLINILATCFRSIFFFNPFAQLFYKALERERELACDDGVLELGYEPAIYAEALFSLEKYRQTNPGFSLAVDGKKPWLLMDRIRRVLGKPARKEKGFSPKHLYGFAAAFIFFGLQLMALPDRRISASVRESGIPVHYEQAEEKFIPSVSALAISTAQKKQSVNPVIPYKTAKQKKVREIETFTITPGKTPVVPEGAEESFYVDNNTVRNFSNESEAGPITIPVQVFHGSPYVPAASLSYEDLPENNAEDSMNQKLVEICLKDVETATRLRSVILLKNLQREIEKSNKEVRAIEMKNKRMILLDQKNIQPVLSKLHQDMKDKKKEIETMRLRLQISSAEIIHI